VGAELEFNRGSSTIFAISIATSSAAAADKEVGCKIPVTG